MESIFLKSINLGILVEKEIVVQTNHEVDGDLAASHPPSIVSIVHSGSDLRRGTITSEAQEIASSRPHSKMVPRPDVRERDNPEEDLAEFFRREPPPGNFMSIPDDVSVHSVRRKWDMFKVFGKRRKSRKRQPPLIKLPDTAVSARTITGHRYIAISIPSEHSQYEMASAQQQHPVPRTTETNPRQGVDPEHNPASERDTQVPTAVTGNQEQQSSASLGPRSLTHPEALSWLASPSGNLSGLSTVASQEGTNFAKGKEPERENKPQRSMSSRLPMNSSGARRTASYTERESRSRTRSAEGRGKERMKAPDLEVLTVGIVPKIVEIPPPKQTGKRPVTGDDLMAKDTLSKAGKSHGTPHTLSANLLSASVLPVRTSSKRAVTTAAAAAENATLSRLPVASRAPSSNNGDSEHRSRTGPRGSFAESLLTTESSPKLLKAEVVTAHQSVPIVVRPLSKPEIDSPLNLNFPSPPNNNKIHRSVQANILSSSTAAEGATGRRDRVRERKKRDMEKLKAQMHQRPASRFLQVEPRAEDAGPESPVLGRWNQEPGLPPSRPYLAGKMSDIGPLRPGVQIKSPYLPPEGGAQKRRGRSVSAPLLSSSSPPSSSLESPKAPWEDSKSYYRRKERQAEHEEAAARRKRFAAHALAEQKETEERVMRQELLRRYERLKESRTKDMEKRLRRLERNEEVLVQSLVSLMETLNTLLQDRQVLPRSASSATSSIPRPRTQHHRHRRSNERRTQSLRSARSSDSPLEALRSQQEQRGSASRRYHARSLRLPGQGPGSREDHSGTARRTRQSRGREEETGEISTGVRQSVLEALQEHLHSPSHSYSHASTRACRIPSYSSSVSSTHSSDTGSLEIMEPLMRELQEAAGYGVERRQGGERAEEGGTTLGESEVFNLF
ncbi:uncharacterized protein F4812DRAFT_460865 [Daldinia caldariorum]|uniref:uncharacterized protein n=1 Tax=Daldinia caldariorum TaxID=326644 RepID=UPI0020074891|nr:uncharacterized protein F4812DRAFT_460865 [Daldinia caldariorum]KAI1466597.1 hypothetical protein F4812DRAFT_460865 [Daldinia caldariorum]